MHRAASQTSAALGLMEKRFSRWGFQGQILRFPKFKNISRVVFHCPWCGRYHISTVIMLDVDYMDLRWPWNVELSYGSHLLCNFHVVWQLAAPPQTYVYVDDVEHSVWERRQFYSSWLKAWMTSGMEFKTRSNITSSHRFALKIV